MGALKYFPIFLFAGLLGLSRAAHSEHDRLDCFLTGTQAPTEAECRERGCHYEAATLERAPWCFLDTTKMGYALKGQPSRTPSGFEANLQVAADSAKQTGLKTIEQLKTEVIFLTKKIVRIRIVDPSTKRYEVPIQFTDFNIPQPVGPSGDHEYKVELNGAFNLTVIRSANGEKLLDTSIGGLIYSDTFLQFATHLASPAVYGIGEQTHATFKHDLFYRTLPLFARDRPTGEGERNHYGTHPFFTTLEKDGRAHGIFLLNSNAMSFTTLPAPGMSIKAFGGILDFFVILGDDPEDVLRQYQGIIGKPVMPPFWALGFQLCRYGYKNLDHVKRVLNRNLNAGMPVDVQYLDIDYLRQQRDFTYEKALFDGLPAYIRSTQAKNIRWTLILDPAIEGDQANYTAFNTGYEKDVFIKWPQSIPPEKRSKPANAPSDKDVMYGHVWPPGPAAFPDFFKNVTRDWWKVRMAELHSVLNYDAIWIDMNEPANFPNSEFLVCPADSLDVKLPSQSFPDLFSQQTICMSAVQGENNELRHYDVHNLYGWSETKPTFEAVREITGKRSYVVTRSTYPSSGQFAAHWLGDNSANWDQLRHSIIAMMEFSLFGISFTGSDICGFIGEATAELCKRWFQLGAFYPFSRAHNAEGIVDQDPAWWKENGHPEVTIAAVEAYRVRYQILHYFYTCMYRSHVYGDSVVRPMHHVFPKDVLARDIDQQFFVGSSLLFAPFVHQGQTYSSAYLNSETRWYAWSPETKFLKPIELKNDRYELHDNSSSFPIIVRGGSIIPVVADSQLKSPLNTVSLRNAPIELWVAPDLAGNAQGELFYDDGEQIDSIEKGHYNLLDFTLHNCSLTFEKTHSQLGVYDDLSISTIRIPVLRPSNLGEIQVSSSPTGLSVSRVEVHKSSVAVHFDPPKKLSQLTKTTVLYFKNLC